MTIGDDLTALERSISAALTDGRDKSLVERLENLDKISHEAANAWSGSNLGYHANTYYAGLRGKPGHVQFSAEWGLIEAWPAHEPDRNWQTMDRGDAIAILLQRAGIDNLDEIETKLASQRGRLSELKEQAISLLTSLLAGKEDAFVSRKLAQIEKIKLAAPGEIASSLVQRGHVISRDMTAMGQGRWIAPHQSLIAVPLSATVTQNGLESLGQAIGLVAQHVSRSKGMKAESGRAIGTNVVLGHGHSTVWKDLRDFVRDRLKLSFDEFNRVPVAGIPNAIRLNQMLDGAAIALVVLTGEDEQIDGSVRARENVVHEAGLFQGRLGFTKAIVLLEEGCNQFSNIEGLGQIRFPKGNIRASFEEIRRVLEREGLLET